MRLLDVLARRREDVEDEPPAGEEQVAGGTERLDSLGVRAEMEVRAKRAGDERHALLDRRAAEVPEPQVEPLRHSGQASLLSADLEHAGRGVDADDVHAGAGGRNRDAAGAHSELDHRSTGRERLVDIEGDVLDDAGAPRVVEPRDRVVRAHGI